MKKISFIIYLALLLILLATNIAVFSIYQINDLSFYLFSSSLYFIFPFLSLLYILFLNIKKIEYKARKHDETFLAILIVVGAILLFIYGKINDYTVIFLSISVALFVVIFIFYGIFNLIKDRSIKLAGGKKE